MFSPSLLVGACFFFFPVSFIHCVSPLFVACDLVLHWLVCCFTFWFEFSFLLLDCSCFVACILDFSTLDDQLSLKNSLQDSDLPSLMLCVLGSVFAKPEIDEK